MWLHYLLLSLVLARSAAGDLHEAPAKAMMMGLTQSPDQPDFHPAGPNSTPLLSSLVQNPESEEEWRTKVLNLLSQLVQIQEEMAKGQVQVIHKLGLLETQGSQQIQDLQNLGRHQSLLVENHQALLLQTSRIATQLEDESASPPRIYLNGKFTPDKSDMILTAGSSFDLSCYGNYSVQLSSSALHLQYEENLKNPLEVRRALPRHTGTYTCRYTNQSLEHLSTWIHLYIKNETDPSSTFVTPRNIFSVKEGEDFLFKCMLTDPSVTNLTLQSEEGLPTGMNVTFDPRRGALIADLKVSFSRWYTCSGWRNGKELRSKALHLVVVPRLRKPPSIFLSQSEIVRLEGEPFEITCYTSNPTHFYNVTWTYPQNQGLRHMNVSSSFKNQVLINTTLHVSAVRHTHSGQYTCRAINEAGDAMATAQLRVLNKHYLQVYLHLQSNAMETRADLVANITSLPLAMQKEVTVNISSLSQDAKVTNNSSDGKDIIQASIANVSSESLVEVYEGGDVTLTFLVDAYPPVRERQWTTPTHVNNNGTTVYQEDYTTDGCRMKASLLLRRVRQEDQGRYSFHFSNSFFNGSHDLYLRMFRAASVDIIKQNSTLTCISSGYPLPTLRWFTCLGVHNSCVESSTLQMSSNITSQVGDKVKTYFQLSPEDDNDLTVQCFADNLVGNSSRVYIHRSRKFSGIFTPVLIGSFGISAVLFLFLSVAVYKWRQKPKYEIRWKIIESTDGNNYTFIDPTQLPYNQKWEFPRDRLRLGAVLGSGAFGKVVEATAYGLGTENKATRVAVKMLKPSAHSVEREALMSELKILSHLGYHDNIVNLLGACTRGGPMLMITEYCCHGDLLNFLRAHAHDFVTSIWSVNTMEEDGCYKNLARLRSDSGISCCSEYQEMQPVISPGQNALGVPSDELSICDLMRFSYQVAQGLDFLSTRNCIHRDVAARNVLLTDHRVAKICDFGLARDIRNDDSYIVQGNARLPVKWMSPESIFQCVYTVQSDVWSYGVLLWEIFSLGKSPYPNIAVDTKFYKMIQDGHHMNQPDFAPDKIYHLMKLCWSQEPTSRPTFKMIGQLISRLLPATNDVSIFHSKQLIYRNIDEVREQEEEEEEVQGDSPKRKEEERDHHDNTVLGDEREPMVKNIYQLS